MEMIQEPVTLIPCLHSLCGVCFTTISKKEKKCPTCRVEVKQVKNDKKLGKVIEKCAEINPQLKKEGEE